MSLDKFTMETATETEELYIQIGSTSYLNQTKSETKSFIVVTRASLIITKI